MQPVSMPVVPGDVDRDARGGRAEDYSDAHLFIDSPMRVWHDRAIVVLRQLVEDLSVGEPVSYATFYEAERLIAEAVNCQRGAI